MKEMKEQQQQATPLPVLFTRCLLVLFAGVFILSVLGSLTMVRKELDYTILYTASYQYEYNDTSVKNTMNCSSRNPSSRIDVLSTQSHRQQVLRKFCQKQSHKYYKNNGPRHKNIYVVDNATLLYCSVPKIACTNWKRLLLLLDGRTSDLFEIKSKDAVHNEAFHMKRFDQMEREERIWRKSSFYNFMFVRHPFERLFSAYRNKLVKPNSNMFQVTYGKDILRMFRKNMTLEETESGKGVTFLEFLKYLINMYDTFKYMHYNEHWQKIMFLCSPCTIKYDYIGHMDTLEVDAKQILEETGFDKDYTFPLNATDKYKKSAKSLHLKYYEKIPRNVTLKLHEIFKDDFDAFGFSTEGYL